MSAQAKVVDSLRKTIATCQAASEALSMSEHPPDSPDDLKLSVLRNDLLSLLSLIYNAATKLSLSLKPSSPTYSAALPLLEDMDKHIAALLHCTRLFKADSFGAALRQEVIDLAGDVFEAAKLLLNSFSSTEATNSRTGQGKAGEEYMIRTASLHAIIDRARSSNGLSDSNLSAVRKAWVQHRSSLEDGLQELTEMIEEAGTENAQKDDFEDGWDELGLDSGQRLGGIELARAKKVAAILKSSVLFHKRIRKETLDPSSYSRWEKHPPQLDNILQHSARLSPATDELVAALYPPQNTSTIQAEATVFHSVITDLKAVIDNVFTESLEEKAAALSLEGSRSEGPSMNWFDTCVEHITRNIQALKDI